MRLFKSAIAVLNASLVTSGGNTGTSFDLELLQSEDLFPYMSFFAFFASGASRLGIPLYFWESKGVGGRSENGD